MSNFFYLSQAQLQHTCPYFPLSSARRASLDGAGQVEKTIAAARERLCV